MRETYVLVKTRENRKKRFFDLNMKTKDGERGELHVGNFLD